MKVLVIKGGGILCNLQLGKDFLFITSLILQFMIRIGVVLHKFVLRI